MNAIPFRSYMRFPYCLKDYLNPRHYYYYVLANWQRARRGYADRDLWSFDHYWASVLAQALPHFLNSNPNGHLIYTLESTTFGDQISDERLAEMQQEWDTWLQGHIDSLAAYVSEPEDIADVRRYYESEMARYAAAQQALRELADYFGAFWD